MLDDVDVGSLRALLARAEIAGLVAVAVDPRDAVLDFRRQGVEAPRFSKHAIDQCLRDAVARQIEEADGLGDLLQTRGHALATTGLSAQIRRHVEQRDFLGRNPDSP